MSMQNEGAKVLVTFWIQQEIAAEAEALACKEGLTRSSYARRSLLRDLEAQEANRPTA
jgi:hypothetical protein